MFSANLGFLFSDLSVLERVQSVERAGFDAVECHSPYDTPAAKLSATLEETGMKMLELNTVPGDVAAKDFGLCAVPGLEEEAQAAIRQSVTYAARIDAVNVHVMAGRTDGGGQANDVYRENPSYACDLAAAQGMTILIEAVNHRDVPGYHLAFVEKGQGADRRSGTGQSEADVRLLPHPDHAGRPDRAPATVHARDRTYADRGRARPGRAGRRRDALPEPDCLDPGMGFTAPIGAEYKPRNCKTEQGLNRLRKFKKDLR